MAPLLVIILVLFGIILLICGVLAIFLLHLAYVHSNYGHLPGPPRSSFIFGHLPEIQKYRDNGRTLMHYLLDNRLKYGPIFVLFYGYLPLVVVGDASYMRELLLTNHKYALKSDFVYDKIGFIFGERFSGHGLVANTDDNLWQKRRQLMNPAFHRKSLKNFVTHFDMVCDRFLARLTHLAKTEEEVSMLKEFSCVTLDVISKVLLDTSIGAIENPDSVFLTAITSAFRGIQANLNSSLHAKMLFIFQYRLFQTTSQKRQIEAAKFLRKFAFECITNRINDVKADKTVPDDLLSLLISDKSLAMDDLVDEFVTMFSAGEETTASSLAFALFEILKNPHVENKILSELNDVLGARENVGFEDLAKMKYLGQVLQEALRMYPIAAGPIRTLGKELTLGGYRIPKGAMFISEKYIFHRNPELWENPDVFDPERFSEPEKNTKLMQNYFPFSIGPRNCIGQIFAKFESKIILGQILRKFQFQLSPGQTAAIEEKFTLAPRDGVVCKIVARAK